ncbi:hypothetical protein A3740_20275 [Oleiphilus sp. HI0068]|nr:hypothetical protein A3740_20275 [Oleiphilus sp. HI0068]
MFTLNAKEQVSLFAQAFRLIQKDSDVQNGIVVGPHGDVTFSKAGTSTTLTLDIQGSKYTADTTLKPSDSIGTTLTFTIDKKGGRG